MIDDQKKEKGEDLRMVWFYDLWRLSQALDDELDGLECGGLMDDRAKFVPSYVSIVYMVCFFVSCIGLCFYN